MNRRLQCTRLWTTGFRSTLEFLESIEVEFFRIPVVLIEEVIQGPFALCWHYVSGIALNRLVSGGDRATNIRFRVSLVMVGEVIKSVDWIGSRQKSGVGKHLPHGATWIEKVLNVSQMDF